jgi:hypothetical protein
VNCSGSAGSVLGAKNACAPCGARRPLLTALPQGGYGRGPGHGPASDKYAPLLAPDAQPTRVVGPRFSWWEVLCMARVGVRRGGAWRQPVRSSSYATGPATLPCACCMPALRGARPGAAAQ